MKVAPELTTGQDDSGTIYHELFYDSLEQESFQSARVIVPAVMDLLHPRSVLDVGCGRGIWLKVFHEHGVPRIEGVDGRHVRAERLSIPQDCFKAVDLSSTFALDGHFDLAVCLEVAEHLPPEMSSALVKVLTNAAPAVLFSAAIPGQGGLHHINEQWPTYWQAFFERSGYLLFDPFRPAIRDNRAVASYYRQNLMLYVSSEYVESSAALSCLSVIDAQSAMQWVHIGAYDQARLLNLTLRSAFANLSRTLRCVPSLAFRAISRKLQS